jgi:hypothetical protein
MPKFKRRHFVQLAGSALTTLGLRQLYNIQNQSLRYGKALAASGSRKLALLVGINNYQNATSLQGAITDINLQRELLIYRFGFNSQDILLVSDESSIKPTREGILQAFEEHLIGQAKPGDTVVYHFSGHGSQVFDVDTNNLNSTFVPSDRFIDQTNQQKTVSDITGKTLFLLMSAINTENLTVVLDSCYSGGGKRGQPGTKGNLGIRSIEGGKGYVSSDLEREYQKKLLSDLKISEPELEKRRQNGIAKGIVIASARENQIATEAHLDGFVTGAFTYLMTQYLWQEASNAPVESIIANTGRSINNVFSSSQSPELEAKTNSNNQTKPLYFINQPIPPAEAVITKVEVNTVDFWLGGVSPQALAAFNRDATFQLIDNQGVEQGKIQLQSRNGLNCTGQVSELSQPKLLKPGAFLQERVRVIPSDYKLRIGLDESLGNDINLAKEEIAKIERVEPVTLQTGEVHYIFGRLTEAQQAELQNKQASYIPPLNSLGLYTEGLEIIPGSFASEGETVSNALNRLQPKFRSLLATRIIKLTLNADSSRLNVAASLNLVDIDKTFAAQTFPSRSLAKLSPFSNPKPSTNNINYQNGIPQIPLHTSVQFQVQNLESKDLYITVLVISSEGDIESIFPNDFSAVENAALIKAGETEEIPKSSDSWQLTVQEPLGLSEVLVIASKSPLRKSLQSLQTLAQRQGLRNSPVSIAENPTNIIDLLLEDIDDSNNPKNRSGNSSSSSEIASKEEVRCDTTQIAAMSITYEAIG